jgi:Zn-dependent protease
VSNTKARGDEFRLTFNYYKFFAKVRTASFLSYKVVLKSFGRSVEIWCDFLNVAILVFLGFSRMDGFHRRAPS